MGGAGIIGPLLAQYCEAMPSIAAIYRRFCGPDEPCAVMVRRNSIHSFSGLMGSLAEILRPGGVAVGRRGTGKGVRELPGGLAEAEALFRRLAQGGTDVTPSDYRGKMVLTGDGGFVGLRPLSKSGPPTIDVRQRGLTIRKLKFVGE